MNSVLQAIQPSATLAISARAKALAAQGASVCNFAAGEPDFDTPDVIKRAAIAAIEAGKTKYTAAKGMPELCRAVAEKFARVNGVAYDPATEILVSSGAATRSSSPPPPGSPTRRWSASPAAARAS